MSIVDEAAVTSALSAIINPVSGRDIVASEQVKAITVREGGAVTFVLEIDADQGMAMEPVREAAEKAVAAMEGVSSVQAMMTAHIANGSSASGGGSEIPVPEFRDISADPVASPSPRPNDQPIGAPKLPGVKRVIAIASGKGGVGKSTVAANLAVALAVRGQSVGVLDADVYGPSQPRMLGISDRPSSPDGHIVLPLRNHGVTLMSIGLMVGEDEALVWRGPMLMGALQQMLAQVQWGKLDVLLVDLPPGTGDVQLTLCQKTDVAGAVIVSTPQDIALLDARKGIDMFKQMGTPILGIIENMAAFVCSDCGKVHHPFGQGGAKAEAARQGVPFLGEIPLDLDIRIASDNGTPIVATAPDSEVAQAVLAIADTLIAHHTADEVRT